MSKEDKPRLTRRNLIMTTGTAAAITGGGSTVVEPVSAQENSGKLSVVVNDGRGMDMEGAPSTLAIDSSSKITLTNISAREGEPCLVKVQAKIEGETDWEMIGKYGFVIESTTESIQASDLDNRDLTKHSGIDLTDFNVDDSSLEDPKDRYRRKKLQMRVVVRTLDGGDVISIDEAKINGFYITYGYQHGVGQNLGRNLGRVAPEYTESGARWDKLDKVPESEPPDWFKHAADVADKIEESGKSGNNESISLPEGDYGLDISNGSVHVQSRPDVKIHINTMEDIDGGEVQAGDSIDIKPEESKINIDKNDE